MKRTTYSLTLALLLGGLGLDTSTALARTNWQSELVFTAISGAVCSNDGWNTQSNALATVLPANIDDNGPDSYFALHFNRRNAYSLKVTGGSLATGAAYTAVGISSAGSSFLFNGSLVKFTQAPAVLTISTRFVTVTGQISNWAGNIGCTVTFEGAFVRRR